MQYTYMKMFILVKKKQLNSVVNVFGFCFSITIKKASKIYLRCHSFHLHVILYEW